MSRHIPCSWDMMSVNPNSPTMVDMITPTCSCGGGDFLGLIHSTPMYKHHQSMACLLAQMSSSMPFISTSYFNHLKVFASVRDDMTLSYDTKVSDLLSAWKNACKIIKIDPYSGTCVFMHYAATDSAFVFLDSDWKTISDEIKEEFTSIFRKIRDDLKCYKFNFESVRTLYCLLSLVESPWENHHYLPLLLNGDPNQDEVAGFMEFEKSGIYALRLKTLCEQNCETKALKLSYLAVCLYNNNFKSKYYCDKQDRTFIKVIYYACLSLSDKMTEVIYQLKDLNPENGGMDLMQWCCSKIHTLSLLPMKSRPRICRHIVYVCEIIAYHLVDVALRSSTYLDYLPELLYRWSFIMLILMKSDIQPNDIRSHFQTKVHEFTKVASTSNSLYLLGDILHVQFNSKLPLTMFIEMYIRALAANLNEKETYKYRFNKEGALESLKTLVKGYLKLANLLKDVISVCRECILTAYSLMPSQDLLNKLENLSIKSEELYRKYPKSVDTSDQYYYSDDDFRFIHTELSNLPDPLTKRMRDYLIIVLKTPRYYDFHWNLKWPDMKKKCLEYLATLDLVLKRNTQLIMDDDSQEPPNDILDLHQHYKAGVVNMFALEDAIGSCPWLKDIRIDSDEFSKPNLRSRNKNYKPKKTSAQLKSVNVPKKRLNSKKSSKKTVNSLSETTTSNINQTSSNDLEDQSNDTKNELEYNSNNTDGEDDTNSKVDDKSDNTDNEVENNSANTENETEDNSDDTENENEDNSGDTENEVEDNSNNTKNEAKNNSDDTEYKIKNNSDDTENKVENNFNNTDCEVEDNFNSKKGTNDSNKISDVIENNSNDAFNKAENDLNDSSNKTKYNSNDTFLEKNDIVKNCKIITEPKLQHQNKRQKRTISTNQHEDFDYSWCPLKREKHKKNNSFGKGSQKNNLNLIKVSSVVKNEKHKSNNLNIDNTKNKLPPPSIKHLSLLSELSSIEFLKPTNTDHIINVVQIQTTSNPLTNVSQTQTEYVSNHHSNNEIEEKANDNDTNSNALDNFVSVYQPNSLNNINSIQNSGIHQGECSFSGSMSVSNQRITESTTKVHNNDQQETSKPIGTHDILLDKNQTSLENRRWNTIQLQNSSGQIQTGNSVHLSSNVIVRTSDVINPSHATTGHLSNTTKKSTYCVKTRDRFIDLSLPASISSTSTNNNRSSTIPTLMNSKIIPNAPVQTSVGLQVNFNNQLCEGTHKIISPSNLSSQLSNISEKSISNNSSALNDKIINSMISRSNTSSNISIINPVLSTQTQTCVGLRPLNEVVSTSNAPIVSLMVNSTQSQVIKTNVNNSYTSSQNQRMLLTELSHTSQTNQSDEQKKIDNLKLISQTFTATSEAIKFVTSNTESQRLIQSTEKINSSNLSVFQNVTESVSSISQDNDDSKLLNRGHKNMRTYESKTRVLKQAIMSDMFVFEKGTLYAVQDDAGSQMESAQSVISPRNNITANIKIQNKQIKEPLEKPKPPNASPNITITGSMLPRFQQVFGKTKFQSSTVINDTPTLVSTSVSSTPSNPGIINNRTNIAATRVYSSSKGVQTNNDVESISSNTISCLSPKEVESKLQPNLGMAKTDNVMSIGNNKNNVIMTCKTVSSLKSLPQASASSSHQLLTCNIEGNNISKKDITSTTPTSKVSIVYTTSCNNSSLSNTNVIYSIPVQNDLKSTNVEKSCVTQIQRQLKMSPSIIQTVLRKHPNWQPNSFRQSKQSIEVQTSSNVERLVPANIPNIVKTTTDSLNNKISVSTSKPNVTETNVSSSMMEQMREFESVLEEVRKTSLMNEMSTTNMLPQINHEIIQIHSPTENVDLLSADSNQQMFSLNKKININNERDRCSFSFLNQSLSNDLANEGKEPVVVSPTIITVRSVTPTPPMVSPNNNVSVNPVDGSTQCPKQIINKTKAVIKPPANSPSTSAVKVPILQKPMPKLQEDEQTTQRIYAILDKYAEQLRNSPELKNKPAPRRRTNPPTNPSLNTKRKKSNQLNLKTCSQQTSCSSSGMEMSPTSDMQAIDDSEDSSNAVSNFSHTINSPSRNSDEQTSTTVASETPLIENTLINVNDVIKKINVDVEKKSKISQSTQIVVSGTSGPFLSIPEGSAGNVRLLLASGKNQKMYRLHCPVFHQITTKDPSSNDIKLPSNILGQNISESTILPTLTSNDIQIPNTRLENDILLNTSQNSSIFKHKINKSDIILESMEKAQVLDNNDKQLSFPIMKKSQGSQSTFSVIHTLPCKPKQESNDKIDILSTAQNNISGNIKKNYSSNEQKMFNSKQELNKCNIGQVVLQQNNLNKIQEDRLCIQSESLGNSNISFKDTEFQSFHSQNKLQEQDTPKLNESNNQPSVTILNENQNNINQISVNCDSKILNNSKNSHAVKCDGSVLNQKSTSNVNTEDTSYSLDVSNSKKMDKEESKPNIVLNEVTAEIISTANQTSNTYKEKKELPKNEKTECELENDNENTLSNTVYNMLDNQASNNINTKIGSLTLRLKNDWSVKNWNNCLLKIIPPGTEKLLEGENLKQLQKSFEHTTIKTFKDLKMFVFEQCKQFDNNVETPKEYDLYDDIDGLGVDKPSTSELFPEVAILNDLDKSVSPTPGLLQASTSKLSDTSVLQAKRKSVLSHTTSSTATATGADHTPSGNRKIKTRVSFLKQALYNEMNQDSNDCEIKPFINGNTKVVLESIEQQIDLNPESPTNITTVDSETCMSEDSTSTISSGTPHYNFRKSKRKNIEEDGFIESQVIKRMYRGRTSESEEKTEPTKLNNMKAQTTEQKQAAEKKESNNRRISNRLKNNVKSNQHTSTKPPQMESQPYKVTTTRASLRRFPRKTI